ncbi:hypothetical protein PRK78_004801 [Emydomyces testavorans]|uniref:RanBD1 domain-containing protein n=1 Tax=Emydomyces testavorans TaxID=2070801 RepID=A0AAF0DKV5_9EURO|nr:hypothetical protein PRK78_004801 [Emydomyces testavorans]
MADSEERAQNGRPNRESASRSPSPTPEQQSHLTENLDDVNVSQSALKGMEGLRLSDFLDRFGQDDWSSGPGGDIPGSRADMFHLKDKIPQLKEDEDELPRHDVEELSEGTKTLRPATASTEISEPVSDETKDGSGERPVRQKLKETSIAGASRQESPEDQLMASQESVPASSDERGRLRRKRSFDESREDDTVDVEAKREDEIGHRRKRSRDSKAQGKPDDQGKLLEPKDGRERTPSRSREPLDEAEKVLSPKKKRSRDQLDKDDLKSANAEKDIEGESLAQDVTDVEQPKVSANNRSAEGEPEKKRHRDDSTERDALKNELLPKPALPNPFANTSATSPFAGLQASKPADSSTKGESPVTKPVTSASAFASSGLATFAGSEKSPFGTIGGGTSVFKPLKPTDTKAEEKETVAPPTAATLSPFPAAGASPFGPLLGGFAASAFANFASSAPKGTGGLTTFASPAGTGSFGGGSKTKPFGAASDDEGGEEEQGEDEARPAFEGLEEVKEDERFYKQETETGEENEKTWYSCRGKLFQFDGKEWKERGIGTFKINAMESLIETEGSSEPKRVVRSARMIMRTDGVLRVVLNSPIFKGMKVGDANGNEPTGKQVHLAGVENGKSMPFLLRTASAESAKDVYHSIQAVMLEIR